MHKKSKLVILISFVMMTFMLLTGCVRSDIGIIMNADGAGTLELSYGVNETYYNSMKDEFGADIFEGKEMALVKDGDTNYICCIEHKQFATFKELEAMLLELEYDTSMVPDEGADTSLNEAPITESEDEPDGADTMPEVKQDYHIFKEVEVRKSSNIMKNGYTFRAVTNKQEVDTSEFASLGVDFGSLFKLVVTVTMPDNISEGSGTVDGKTMTSTITNLSVENEITAVSESVSIINIVIIILAILIVSFIIYMLLRGKKQNTNN